MSEEDIIDIVERIADFGWSDYDDFLTNKKAVQGILDLYNKQKERIKELEEVDLTTVYLDGVYDGEQKWKDKIKEKMEEREYIIHNSKLKYGKDYYIYEDVIIAREEIRLLQKLLEVK